MNETIWLCESHKYPLASSLKENRLTHKGKLHENRKYQKISFIKINNITINI